MQLLLEQDEAWSAMLLVVSQVLDGVQLSAKGADAVKKWRNEYAKESAAMNDLAEAMNEAIAGGSR